MKIGIVCNALANSGGMERYTLDIIRGFVASGHEVTVFTRKVDASLYEATLVKTVKINTKEVPRLLCFQSSALFEKKTSPGCYVGLLPF